MEERLDMNLQDDVNTAKSLAGIHWNLRNEIAKVIVGQDMVIDQVLLSLYCNGHSLLVGVPGLAKTLLIKTISEALDLSFNRIQFTPDLMPSDIIGAEILDEERKFRFIKGPLFAHIVLADEINRTPPKTQAALLEAMQEKNVTAAGQIYPLPKPFYVLATQNPIEQEGTYPLPEAQLDRFMFNIELDYPSFEEEVMVVKSTTGYGSKQVEKVINEQDLLKIQEVIRKVPVSDNVVEYAVGLVSKTRPNTTMAIAKVNEFIAYGAGPRASQNLIMGAKGHALMHGKLSPDIEDVQAVAIPILRHRIVRNYKAEAEGVSVEDIINSLF